MLSQDQIFDDRDVWRLLADELSLLPSMTDTGRLGFAIQLKFRQIREHYPESINEFPSGYGIPVGAIITPGTSRLHGGYRLN